jgi:hypothetical protein
MVYLVMAGGPAFPANAPRRVDFGQEFPPALWLKRNVTLRHSQMRGKV